MTTRFLFYAPSLKIFTDSKDFIEKISDNRAHKNVCVQKSINTTAQWL